MYLRDRQAIVQAQEMAPRNRPVIVRLADMKGWWHRYPKEYEAELACLDSLGHRWAKDEPSFQEGLLVIRIDYPINGSVMELTASYPDSYPYFPPSVGLPELIFSRHQHPIGKNLCLLAREGAQWRPGHDTLASLLKDQVPRLEAVNHPTATADLIAADEDHTGEPLSNFLPCPADCAIIVPDAPPPAGHSAGRLVLHIQEVMTNADQPPFVNGVVRWIADLNRQPLIQFPVKTPAFKREIPGLWLRLTERPQLTPGANAKDSFLRLMESRLPAFNKTIQSAKRGQIIVAGFSYPDEISWRATSEDWVFLAIRIQQEGNNRRPAKLLMQFVRADWGGEDAWLRRAPALRPLRPKSALVVGLGSLGSPVALQLARAGIGQLHLVDFDQLQVGNTVRWGLGWRYAGLNKAQALLNHIGTDYPYTKVNGYPLRIGNLSPPSEASDYQLVRSLTESVDLVIDAAASHTVSHFLADLCKEAGKSYLWLTTTPGCAGGVVGRIRTGQGPGCWHCFQHGLGGGLGDGSIRLPADSGAPDIQPGGCSQPTFIGAGVDSDEVALLAARLAIATLCSGASDGYPGFEWDIAVGDFNRSGVALAPSWTTYKLNTINPCTACSKK